MTFNAAIALVTITFLLMSLVGSIVIIWVMKTGGFYGPVFELQQTIWMMELDILKRKSNNEI